VSPAGPVTQDDLISRNRRTSFAMLAVEFLLVGLAGSAAGIFVTRSVATGIAAGAALALVIDGVAWAIAVRATISLTGAASVEPGEAKVLYDVVGGLCVATGLPQPKVYVVDDPAPNAFAFGRSAANAGGAVTSGLLDLMSRRELEGVLAHELSHIRNHDVQVTTLAVTTIGVLAPIANLGARLLSYAVSREREELADMSAVALVTPDGLRRALEKLESDQTVLHKTAHATAHLWFVEPLELGGPTRKARTNVAFDTHPPIADRIATLRKLEGLDPDQRGPVDATGAGAPVDLQQHYADATKTQALEPADTAADLAAKLAAAAASGRTSEHAVPAPVGQPEGWYHVDDHTLRLWSGSNWVDATATWDGKAWVREQAP
jgi:heat shock protein HtpX